MNRPMTEDKSRVTAILTKNLCRRLHEKGYPTGSSCDGTMVVCGFCGMTAQQMAADLFENATIENVKRQ